MSGLAGIKVRVENGGGGSEGGMGAGGAASGAGTMAGTMAGDRAPSGVAEMGGLGGGVTAILSELVTLLDMLADEGTPAALDMRSLPMSPEDRIELELALGEGEVRATVTAEGVSEIRETRIAGLWWVRHRDAHGDLIAELIEVTRVPEILASDMDEIASAAQALREHITTAAARTARARPR